ncbi:hypothetical protein I8J29_25825 [Paenibacillus sp. MWE-103]|uniref:Uncharacterized protein n=2 Tax=Paenibacillus artemisiicola TaxID=1172618 RepID=A0ABS3WH50_9BACL|nr:hypothetical protein [Paenibacillus artemisiicola]
MQGRYDRLIDRVVERIYAREPELLAKYGERGRVKCREDNHHHMRHLETAFRMQDSRIFTDYAVWLNGILLAHGLETRHLIEAFRLIEESLPLAEAVTEPEIDGFRRDLQAAVERLGRESRSAAAAGCPEVEVTT